jgi:hypothetical protein
MKKYKRTANLLGLTLAASMMNAPVAFADSFNSQALTAGNASVAPTDVYKLTCPAGTASVRARVANPNGNTADEISVLIIGPNGSVRSAISLEGIAPPTAVLPGLTGVYRVAVHKDSTLLAARYSIALDCYRATGVAFPGAQAVLFQNQ